MVVTRLFSAVVLDIGGLDAITLGAPALLLGAVAAVASYLPSRKAMRVDPLQTVRSE
jgi:ABC-type lipoprotein release transport system permease subunit